MLLKKVKSGVFSLRVLVLVAMLSLAFCGFAPLTNANDLPRAGQNIYWLLRVEDEAAVMPTLNVLRDRLNDYGVKDAVIDRQDITGIVIKLQNIPDVERLKGTVLLNAALEFRVVEDQYADLVGTNAALPPECEILYAKNTGNFNGSGDQPYVVRKNAAMTGAYIAEAKPIYEPGYGETFVQIELNAEGAGLFAQITADNIGRRLAIVLDGRIISAPIVHEKISGGRLMLAGNFTLQEASDLALALRAGSLPVPVTLVEERLE